MNTQTTKNKSIRLAYSFAGIALLCSFLVWTQIVHSVVLRHQIVFEDLQYDTQLNTLTIEEPSVKQEFIKYEIAASILHEAAPEEQNVIIVEDEKEDTVAEVLHQNIEENLIKEIDNDIPEEVTEKDVLEPTEFEAWELHSAYTLSIPKVGIYTAVSQPSRTFWDTQEWGLMEEQMQVGLAEGAVAYPHSVRPGTNGNVIIAGHSSPPDARAASNGHGDLFARLPELDQGDIISVIVGSTFVDYKVTSIEIVSPQQTQILAQQDNAAQLKLITCYPIGTTRDRWVVTAEKVIE